MTSSPVTDEHLIQIVDAALADVTRRSGDHLACRPGCSQCCVGAFAINGLDAERLVRGYRALETRDPERFVRVQQRVADYVMRTAADYPGDVVTGALDESRSGQERFEEFGNDEVCPVLDPLSLTCDLYESRPMTCRVFGPPVRAEVVDAPLQNRAEVGLGVCELCFVNASAAEIADCELIADPDHVEDAILRNRVETGASVASTTVAYALSTCF